MNRIEREKSIVAMMVEIYCRRLHGTREGALCAECSELVAYAHRRLSYCRHGESKGTCRKCLTHCYAPLQRERMRRVMRYVGPRMIFIHPFEAIRHLISELR